ncbi:DUF1344 domain-containing protein [Aquibium sp. A9E412]|uniref:DUF1344 domain-containing protein n=1 Tax=Aquibium sp. A9E412 TaxID=2976767 RepID=UPI0025B0F154|nr:DUF1344 domain-containing protein [Aquibium sp. A9E412]MDN2565439.1 DUF1344 domain-containing protein [Aquibium sp. A9E412]
MKKLLATLAATGFLALSAQAAEVEGTVQSVDPAARMIVMEDGTAYTADGAVDLESLTVGSSVTLTVDDASGTVTAVDTGM